MTDLMVSPFGVTISGNLINHVRQLYDKSLVYLSSGNALRRGINGYTPDAPIAYIVSVTSVEAFVNEVFLSDFWKVVYKDSVLWTIQKSVIERMELSTKLVLIPQLLFGQSFPRGLQPYQDMILLIKVRNQFVHYKMEGKPPSFLQDLDQRRISLTLPGNTKSSHDHQWVERLSSSEGIRWAHNTACDVIKSLLSFVPHKSEGRFILESLANNFSPIPDSYAKDWLTERGIDPRSN